MRHLFGLQPSDVAVEKDGELQLLRPAAVGTVYDAYTAGSTITDLLERDGATPATQVIADDDARIGFYGPDNARLLYVDFGYSSRFAMCATTIGAEVAAKANTLDALLRSGDQTATGLKTLVRVFIEMADIVNPGLILRQNNTVVSTLDAEMMQAFYKTLKGWWLNEKAQMRGRRVDSEIVLKLFGRGNDSSANANNDILQGFNDVAGADHMVFRAGASGGIYHKWNDFTAWTPITIDTPTTATKYSANTDGASSYNSPQLRVFDGGRTVRLRGRINVAAVTGVADEVIASALPTSLSRLGMTADAAWSAVPPMNRHFAGGYTGGGAQRLRVNTSGSLQALGTVAGGSGVWISLDGCSYSLES